MSASLHNRILQAIRDRTLWEERQRIWYMMRHDGLRRRSKPYKGAPDLHFPMVDTAIEKLKPFYFSQIYAGQQLASFTPQSGAPADAGAAAAEVFDLILKNETDFDTEALSVIDAMLLHGRGVLKLRWDALEARIQFEEVNPVYLIVPRAAVSLERADFLVHVKQLTRCEYEAERRYEQAAGTVLRISGSPDAARMGTLDVEKSHREGITYATDPDVVILWEVYERTPGGWTVYTISPMVPGESIRKPFGVPYKDRAGKALLPFVGFSIEVKDKGWYAPRGIAERLAAFETYATKTWNAKAEHLDFSGRPLFTSSTPLSNTTNVRFSPGEILPEGVAPVSMPLPPISLDQEITNTRLIGEQSIMMPDFGVGESSKQGGQETKTATEVNYIQTIATQGVDLRGRIFRRSLSEVYRKAWAMLVQFAPEKLARNTSQTRKVLTAEAAADNYLIEPDGATDGWNKQARVGRAIARFQMLSGHPNINQEELVKSVLEEDDPRLVKRLLVSGRQKAASESEDEAFEVLLLMSGYPAQAQPGENHALRIQILMGKLAQLAQLGAPVDPVARQRLQEHVAQHVQMLQSENPKLGRQVVGAIGALEMAPQADPRARRATRAKMMQPEAVASPMEEAI